ncbi:ATP-binding cassette domain-containing protein [Bacillus cereus group sp. MYBK30-1]|uniref:ATP-binding cassette domain-containing protein n=1 Tax=Bacillus cereus group sp. MYBK30-1 TaxID=3450636 RepID=UPI003F795827
MGVLLSTNSGINEKYRYSSWEGCRYFLCGPGKSTVFSLIERFYDPTKGDILLDDICYKNIHVEEWRQKFSYVSQDTPIFFRDNFT